MLKPTRMALEDIEREIRGVAVMTRSAVELKLPREAVLDLARSAAERISAELISISSRLYAESQSDDFHGQRAQVALMLLAGVTVTLPPEPER